MPQVGCPNCGNLTTVLGSSLRVTCGACGTAFSPPGAPAQAQQRAPAHFAQQPLAYPAQSPAAYPGGPVMAPQPVRKRMPIWGILLIILLPMALIGGLALWGLSSFFGVPDQEDWVEYRSEPGGYTARFPQAPMELQQAQTSEAGTTTVYTAERVVRGGLFGISCFDIPRGGEFDLKAGLRAATEPGVKMTSTRPTKHQGIDALIAEYEGGEFPQRMMAMIVHRRVYLIGIDGRLEYWDYFVENFRIDESVLAGKTARNPGALPEPKPEIKPLEMKDTAVMRVYEGEVVKTALYASGGRAPYRWDLTGLRQDWQQTTAEVPASWESPSGTSCVISGKAAPGEYVVSGTVTDADGRRASGSARVEVLSLPAVLGELKLFASPDRAAKLPVVAGDTVTTYPGIYTRFSVGVESLVAQHRATSAVVECKDEILPPHGSTRHGTLSLEFSGYWQAAGEYTFTVSAKAELWTLGKSFTLSKEFKLSVIDFPEDLWPKSAGKLTVSNGQADVGRDYTYRVAELKLATPKFPYAHGDWPATVEWSWDETQLPPGMRVTKEDYAWQIIGKPTTAGTYVVDVKGTVTFKWTSQSYEVAEQVVITIKGQ